jgi:hypothetical protein
MSLDETRTRFLAAIAKQVDPARVIEVHIFPSIKQGATESGVAVVAVERELPHTLDVDGGEEVPAGLAEDAVIESAEAVAVEEQLVDETQFVADEVADDAAVALVDDVTNVTNVTNEDTSDADEKEAAGLDAEDEAVADLAELTGDESGTGDDEEEGEVIGAAPPSRYTVYSARYRHTLKGPDRGKWEVAVTEEADAPLLTVDAVVRGVQRRSGDSDETMRLSGDEFRAALPAPAA